MEWLLHAERHDPSDAVLAGLWRLANTPFTLMSFQAAWRALGWRWTRTDGDEYGFQVELPHEHPLSVDPLGAQVLSVRLPVAFIDEEPWRPDFAEDAQAARREFDRAFVDLRARLALLAGEPRLDWQDADDSGYRAAVWGTAHGTVIAQQAAFDPAERGDEVDVWLDGARFEDLRCDTPLIDVLCRRSQSLHDRHGFPSLPDDT